VSFLDSRPAPRETPLAVTEEAATARLGFDFNFDFIAPSGITTPINTGKFHPPERGSMEVQLSPPILAIFRARGWRHRYQRGDEQAWRAIMTERRSDRDVAISRMKAGGVLSPPARSAIVE
jgi:hypothetical protein